jgi:signal transduction histidine kinase
VILDGEVTTTGHSRTWADAAAIRRTHPTLPVVMFTADSAAVAEAEAGTSRRSRAAGFAGIVAKPFVVEEFLATVKNAVDGPALNPIMVFPNVAQLTADWAQTDMFEMVVHELRAPLTVIRGQAQLALRYVGKSPERERNAINAAIVQADRMTHMITELLDHAQLSANGLSLAVAPFDLADAITEAITRHDYGATPRITLKRQPGHARVNGDKGRIAQILDNLLNNAVKYSGPAAPIEVSLTTSAVEVLIRITDHGVGIPADEQERVFTPFYRTTRTRDVPGTGLGLHISRRLAERHGGRLWLEASSESGSVFALALPVAP